MNGIYSGQFQHIQIIGHFILIHLPTEHQQLLELVLSIRVHT